MTKKKRISNSVTWNVCANAENISIRELQLNYITQYSIEEIAKGKRFFGFYILLYLSDVRYAIARASAASSGFGISLSQSTILRAF
jgi:hypothetical protein